MIRSSLPISITDTTSAAYARRQALQCAETARFSSNAANRLALVVTELATNLIKHAGSGTIILGTDPDNAYTIGVTSIDKGRGIANLGVAMQDGYSTAGSPGNGLGAIARMTTGLDVYSQPDRGTALVCRVVDDEAAPRIPSFDGEATLRVAGICVPYPGEEAVGDSWTVARGRQAVTICVADGLGHGFLAAEASQRAIGIVRERDRESLEQLMQDMHEPLRSTRGAAVGLARVHLASRKVEWVGVGNIGGVIFDDVARRTVSTNGTVGAEMRRVQLFTYPWSADSTLVMFSDGLAASWTLDAYPGLQSRQPALIAAVLFRDHCRGRDDVTVVVAKA